MNRKQHWEQVYQERSAESVSWYQPRAELSLRLIQNIAPDKQAAIIDIGGGASALAGDLLDDGFTDVSVLDISAKALEMAKRRLLGKAGQVAWIEGDITRLDLPPCRYDLWHDRAVFPFLTEPEDRPAYVRQVLRAVRPGGHVVIASFAEDGPEKCSGLPVMRYSPEALHAQFGNAFRLLGHEREAHQTPAGKEQPFTYCHCRLEKN